MDCRVKSAFTPVFRRAMPGNDAGWMCMPRFAANLAFLFTERPLIERFAAAAAAGFRAVELQLPYDHAPSAAAAAKRSISGRSVKR